MAFVVRQLSQEHLLDVVAIHRSALPGDLLPALGEALLLRHYQFCTSAQNLSRICLLGAFRADCLVGFAQVNLGRLSMPHFYGTPFIFSLIRLLFLRPIVFVNGIIQVFHGQVIDSRSADLAFFAVEPSFQGHGVGRLLLSSLSELAVENGFDYVSTKTANHRLSLFYQRIFGAQVMSSFGGWGVKYYSLRWTARSSL